MKDVYIYTAPGGDMHMSFLFGFMDEEEGELRLRYLELDYDHDDNLMFGGLDTSGILKDDVLLKKVRV